VTTSPHVELLAPGLELAALSRVDGRVGSVEEQIQSGLMSYRLLVINYVKNRLVEEKEITTSKILQLLNEASALFLGRFNAIVGPAAATAYIRAYQAANAGDVPVATIYALADQHTKRIAAYYDETSREGLVSGFNTFVNRQIPARVAADRAMDAYGLTPRQMSGYASLDVRQKIDSARPVSLKRRALEYIGTSIRRRVKLFATQEAHNMDLQAKQTAWLWMQDKGALSERAQKMWLTAKDEKTCKVCGPMHGKKIGIAERFELPNGIKVWVPGPHPNCRCEIRVMDLKSVSKIAKAGPGDKWYEDEFPRTKDGRFSRYRQAAPETKTEERGSIIPLAPLEMEEEVAVEEPVIETTPTLQLGPPKETLRVSPPKLKVPTPKLQVGEPKLNLGAKTRDKLEMSREKAELKLSMPSLTKLALEQEIVQQLQMAKTKEKRRTFIWPTIPIMGESRERYPVYAVLTPHDTDKLHRERLTATPEMRWIPEETVVAEYASRALEEMVMEKYTEIVHDRGGRIEMKGVDGQTYYAIVEDEDVQELVEAVAYGNYTGDPDWTGMNTVVHVQWVTDMGDDVKHWQTPERLTYGDLVDEFELDPDDFKIVIARMTDGHDSNLGRTWQDEAGSRYGLEVWRTEGDYVLEDNPNVGGIQIAGFRGKIPVKDAIPDVEMEEFGWRGD
jgi:hypothetical protein